MAEVAEVLKRTSEAWVTQTVFGMKGQALRNEAALRALAIEYGATEWHSDGEVAEVYFGGISPEVVGDRPHRFMDAAMDSEFV